MKRKKIDVKFYGSDQNSELFSFDKETFDLITGANAELSKMVTDKDHKIAVLERALRNAVVEYDFAKYKEQSTTIENIERILNLEQKLINQAENELEEEE